MRVLTLIVAAAAFALLVREAGADPWAMPAAVHALLVLGLAGIVVLAVRVRRPGARWGAAAVALVAVCAALPLWPARPQPERWRAHEEARLRQRFDATRATIAAHEERVERIASGARALLDTSAAPGPDARVRLFEALAVLLEREAPARADASVQVYDSTGALVAWAGAPHPYDPDGRLTRLAAAARPV